MMNKPRGVLTTASDEKGRKTIYDLMEPGSAWVGPVGRLDKASEGLLLLTNDSEWAAKITDPVSHLDKKYHVQVNCVADATLLAKISRVVDAVGKDLPRARSPEQLREPLRVKAASILRHGEKNSWLEITLDEGKNRQIRRMLETLNVEVLRLVRVSIGPLKLGDLRKGAARQLTAWEKEALDQTLLTVSYRAQRGTPTPNKHSRGSRAPSLRSG
jgi:23S rRNA pseudouridine2605 synthase